MTYLLDTDICIYTIKNRFAGLVKKLRQVGIENVGVSSITVAELEYGVSNSNRSGESRAKLYEFMVPFAFFDFDLNAARQYGKIRKELKDLGQPIGPMDMLIASIAMANGQTLVTNNTKEFGKVPGLKTENWIEV
jgi:tRNA(fMet)-specific endonuclease VapC